MSLISQTFDAVVIGSGPAGEGAAMQLAKGGKSVAMVEAFSQVGGGCTHWGTIPSKALRHTVSQIADFNQSLVLTGGKGIRPDYPLIRKQAESVISRQVKMREGFYIRNDVPVFQGRATLADPHTVMVESTQAGDGDLIRLEAKTIVIATGSRPYRPADIDFKHPRIFDADTILGMDFTPRTMIVYGAGVIGCEYASIFRGLGIKVNLVDTRGRLLEFLDDEIVDALTYHLRDQGVVVRHNETYTKVTGEADGVTMECASGKKISADVLLFTNGRSGNTDGMGLDKVGIGVNHRGQIAINEHFQTALPHIFAAGDVIGPPALASAAYDQGRYAAQYALDGKVDHGLTKMTPTGIYTSPEISSLGRTEQELTTAKVPYEVGHAFFKDLARAQIAGRAVGMLKLLFHRDTLELLGIHCFGAQAAEIVHIGQAIMAQPAPHNTVKYFVETTFNYPTMAEAYRVAALNGLNRLK